VKDPARAVDDLESLDLHNAALAPMVDTVVGWLMENEPDPEGLAQHLQIAGLGKVVDSLSDPGSRLEDPTTWRNCYRALREYHGLEAAVQQAKAQMSTPAGMQNFMALKAQRDLAKRAL
jgi:hypothetical protein